MVPRSITQFLLCVCKMAVKNRMFSFVLMVIWAPLVEAKENQDENGMLENCRLFNQRAAS